MEDVVIVVMFKLGKNKDFVQNILVNQRIYKQMKNKRKIT